MSFKKINEILFLASLPSEICSYYLTGRMLEVDINVKSFEINGSYVNWVGTGARLENLTFLWVCLGQPQGMC